MTDVFISYSRKDTDFVRQLFDDLKTRGCEAWVDWQGIDYSSKWWEEICAGIEGADNFVLILSPDSLNSIYCHREIEHARKHNKRIIPFIYRPWDEKSLVGGWYTIPDMRPHEAMARENWEVLQAIQYIDYHGKLSADFDRSITALLTTVNTDPERVRLHTRLILRIRDWEGRGRSPSALLRGDELAAYETWLAKTDAANDEPRTTADQRAYITESRQVEDEDARLDALRERRIRQFRLTALILGVIGTLAVIVTLVAVNQADTTGKQVALAGQTLTPIPPTLTSVARAIADALEIQEIAVQFANASLRMAEGQQQDALQLANAMIESYPNQPMAFFCRGLIYDLANQDDNAIADFTQAIQLHPGYGRAYYSRAKVYYDQGKFDEAISDYSSTIVLDPQDTRAYVNRGNSYFGQGKFDEAIADYTQAIKIDPQDLNAHDNRGLAYANQGKLDEAIADYTQAIKIDPQHPWAYPSRGLAYYDQGKFDEAIADYTQAIQLDPQDAWSYANRGIAYADQGKFDEAIADYTQAVELDPQDAGSYTNRGHVYALQGRLNEAIADFNQVLEIDQQSPNAYLARGYLHYLQNQFPEALAAWETYEQLAGGFPHKLQSVRAEMVATLTAMPTIPLISTAAP
jgi:tetratricopeptide (TPR) repeat protein